MVKRLYKLIFVAFLTALSSVEVHSQGLGFHGMDYLIDQRTSYDVFGRHPENFDAEFFIEFELYTQPSSEFGYFFRVKDVSGSRRIWNLSYDSRGDSITVRLNEEGRQSLIKAGIPHDRLKHLHWHRVRIDFDLIRDSVRLDIAGLSFSTHFPGLPDKVKAAVIFGRSDHIIDVPSFAIRGLKIGNSRKSYSFPLDSTEGSVVCDDRFRIEGRVENPEWLINSAMKWKECARFSYSGIAGASYNPVRKEFYYFTDSQMTVLDFMNDRDRHFDFAKPCPVAMKLGNNIVSEDGKRLICYELYDDSAASVSPSVAEFDLDVEEWRTLSSDRMSMPMHHHAGFINPATGRYTVLGGFGNMQYNGDFFEFDSDTGLWRRIWEDQAGAGVIYPRYFTSAGTDGRYVYIYGGMGNECGEQVVGRQYFYDFYRIDPLTGSCERLWTLNWDENDKVPVRSLIVDGDCFYTLCYSEYISKSELYLYRFSIADGTKERLCNSIPITSDKMRTNANIYLDRDMGRFFVTVQEFEDDIKSTLKIYSLSYPPVTQMKNISDRGKILRLALVRKGWLIIAGLAFLAAGVWFYGKNKKRGEGASSSGVTERKTFRYPFAADCISLFGDFTVIDRDGKDITTLFTRQQILILCLLIKRGDSGISTKRLSSILWPDKEEDKVKNSRGVAINNLRRSLSYLSGAVISFRDGRYYLEFQGECGCDYLCLMAGLKEKEIEKDRIIGIISRGKFLGSIDDEIFDDFKEKTDNMVLPLLQDEMERRYRSKDYGAVLELWEMIGRIDPVDESSMQVVIRALKRQKRIEEALVLYSTFCSEYKKANDADFGKSFRELR